MWDIKDSDFDLTYIGQWDITLLDNYLSQKSGTQIKNAVVRSIVDREKGVITLYSHVPNFYNSNHIIMNGEHGICGKIGEKTKIGTTTVGKINTLYLYNISPDDVKHKVKTEEGKYVLHGKCEFDDLVFNGNKEYIFDVTYYICGDKKPILHGMTIEIPIDKFNNYVKMRDIWYFEYEGSKSILPND